MSEIEKTGYFAPRADQIRKFATKRPLLLDVLLVYARFVGVRVVETEFSAGNALVACWRKPRFCTNGGEVQGGAFRAIGQRKAVRVIAGGVVGVSIVGKDRDRGRYIGNDDL